MKVPEIVPQEGYEGREGVFSDMFDGHMWTLYSPAVYEEEDADWVVPTKVVQFAEGELVSREITPEEARPYMSEAGWSALAGMLSAVGKLLGGESVPMQFNLREKDVTIKDRTYTFLWKPHKVMEDGALYWAGKAPEEEI